MVTPNRRENPEAQQILATTRKSGEVVINSKVIITLIVGVITGLTTSGFSLGGNEVILSEINALTEDLALHKADIAREISAVESQLENRLNATASQITNECVLRVQRLDAKDDAMKGRMSAVERVVAELHDTTHGVRP